MSDLRRDVRPGPPPRTDRADFVIRCISDITRQIAVAGDHARIRPVSLAGDTLDLAWALVNRLTGR
jgi:hypothetical protein